MPHIILYFSITNYQCLHVQMMVNSVLAALEIDLTEQLLFMAKTPGWDNRWFKLPTWF